ncbi:MAG: insulinase family protein [Spirochaetaceae bacterium]|jgi:zinc protease|nr:insulinase family protein [Spirochaetaceae bacterium]
MCSVFSVLILFRKNHRRIHFLAFLVALWVALAACAGIPHPAADSAPLREDPAILTGKLGNGLAYRILRNPMPENRILLRLVVRAGSLVEDEDQRGIAHLVEHMAFEGSAHFQANELISYFESIGMDFGADVNAYTSFEETVYMLEVPADDPAMLDTALTVVQDWTDTISFDPERLEKERAVVIEEWRLGRGYSGRVQDKMLPFLFADSRYAQRKVIGDPEIIRTISRDRIMDFYHAWYRPEMMTVVIVGDADPLYIEEKIKQYLSLVPGGDIKTEAPEYTVPIQGDPRALVITDAENPYTQAQVYHFSPPEPVRTEADFAAALVREIAGAALSERLNERLEEENSPILAAGSNISPFLRKLTAAHTWLVPKDGQWTAAFHSLLEELDRYGRFGITEGELDRQKQRILSGSRLSWQNRDKTPSQDKAYALVNSVLDGSPLLSPDEKYELTRKSLGTIRKNDVDGAIRRYFSGRGTMLLVVTRPPEGLPLSPEVLSQEEIRADWHGYRPVSPLEPWPENADDAPLWPGYPLPGFITAERLLPDGTGSPGKNPVTELTLSNGAVVWIRPTDFEADTFLFTAVSRGGLSLLTDEEYPSAQVAGDYLELSGLNGFSAAEVTKKLTGKNIRIQANLNETTATLSGSSSATDRETFFQLINLYFTVPYWTDAAWGRLLSDLRTEILARKNRPEAVFVDAVLQEVYGDSIRHGNVSEKFLNMLDPAKSEGFYRRFFSGAENFVFIFTGDVRLEDIRILSERYIASLPRHPIPEPADPRDTSLPFPRGKPIVTVRKGLEAQSQVLILFGGRDPPAVGDVYAEQDLINAMIGLLDIRLREKVRENIGGTYSVGASTALATYPRRRFVSQISFGCEPERADALAAAVLEEIAVLQKNPASDTDMVKLRETFVRNRETGYKNNAFWHGNLVRNISRGDRSAAIAGEDTVRELLTAETMRRMIAQYFPLDNYLSAFLFPE